MKNKADELQCFLAHVDPDTGRKQSVKEHLEHVCYLSEKNCPLVLEPLPVPVQSVP